MARISHILENPARFFVVVAQEHKAFPLSIGLTGSGFSDEFLICGENRFNRITSRKGKIASKTNSMHLLVKIVFLFKD